MNNLISCNGQYDECATNVLFSLISGLTISLLLFQVRRKH